MHLREFFADDAINLSLQGSGKDEIIAELVALINVDDRSADALLKLLRRRESLGSTGVGRGIAIPHCRTPVVTQLQLAFGRHVAGLDYRAIDDKPVHDFFLIVAPPIEVSNQYLPVLGKIAQLAKEADVPERLAGVATPEEFFALLKEKGV